MFEKKAAEFKWPRERWVALVSNVLKGKALEAYDKMSVTDLDDYEEFKTAILKAYELRPEAYRAMFRGARKRPADTYVNYARYLEETLEKWLLSEETATYQDLKEQILMEHFTNTADREIAAKIREKRFKTVKEASTWADDRVLALRSTGSKYNSTFFQPRDKTSVGTGASNKSSVQEKGSLNKDNVNKTQKSGSGIRCYHCNKIGHVKSQCRQLKASQEAKPVALVLGLGQSGAVEGQGDDVGMVPGKLGCSQECTLPRETVVTHESYPSPGEPSSDTSLDWCKPFLCQGKVTIGGVVYPVTVVRDTAAQQSMCRNVTGGPVHTGEYVMCRGVNTDNSLSVCPGHS